MTLTLEQIAIYEERLSHANPFQRYEIPALDAVYWVLRDMLTNEKMRLENEEKVWEAFGSPERPTPPGHDTAIEALPGEDSGGVGG